MFGKIFQAEMSAGPRTIKELKMVLFLGSYKSTLLGLCNGRIAQVVCTKGEQRYPPDSDFLKLSKHVQ